MGISTSLHWRAFDVSGERKKFRRETASGVVVYPASFAPDEAWSSVQIYVCSLPLVCPQGVSASADRLECMIFRQ